MVVFENAERVKARGSNNNNTEKEGRIINWSDHVYDWRFQIFELK